MTSNHRGHGHCIAKGADIRRMMAELFGRVDGYCKGKGGSMHIADFAVGMLGANGIVGGGLPIACRRRARRPARRQGRRRRCASSATARPREGEFHEALNIASVWKLPIVFVCENNQYAANNAVGVQHPVADIAAHARRATACPASSSTATTCCAVRAAAARPWPARGAAKARASLECKTYRWHFHAMRDAPPPETPPGGRDRARGRRATRSPASRRTLLGAGPADARREIGAMREQASTADLAEAVAFAEASPFPDPKDLLVDMFAE